MATPHGAITIALHAHAVDAGSEPESNEVGRVDLPLTIEGRSDGTFTVSVDPNPITALVGLPARMREVARRLQAMGEDPDTLNQVGIGYRRAATAILEVIGDE